MSERVAKDHLKAFVERIQRPADRVEYAVPLLGECMGISPRVAHRAYRLAAELFGAPYWLASIAVSRAMVGDNSRLLEIARPLSADVVGFTYAVRTAVFPGRVKYGFTREPERRAIELAGVFGAPVSMGDLTPGTMLDELALHCRNHHRNIFGEWFRDA